LSINAKFKLAKAYTDTWNTIFRAVYDMLKVHVHSTFKLASATKALVRGKHPSAFDGNKV
jgi:hypothetical protein